MYGKKGEEGVTVFDVVLFSSSAERFRTAYAGHDHGSYSIMYIFIYLEGCNNKLGILAIL